MEGFGGEKSTAVKVTLLGPRVSLRSPCLSDPPPLSLSQVPLPPLVPQIIGILLGSVLRPLPFSCSTISWVSQLLCSESFNCS